MKLDRLRSAVAALGLTVALAGGVYVHRHREKEGRNQSPTSTRITLPEVIEQSFQLVERVEDRFSTRTTFRKGEQVLNLETIGDLDADSAQTLIEDGIMGVHALYAQALSAYPENLSKQVSAPEHFRPRFYRREHDGVRYNYFLLYANDRSAYGATDEDSVKQRSLLGWIYCEHRQTVYKIRMFAPLATPHATLEEFFLSLPCE
jgi:hypothetical protein